MNQKKSALVKKQTKSLCNVCQEEIDASVYTDRSNVFLKKECPFHGNFRSLIEKDVGCYEKLAHLKKRPEDEKFHTLVIPVTYKCNLNCEFCFLPHRNKNNLSLGKIKEIIDGFSGHSIGLSGGEPTLSGNLPDIIRYVVEKNKKPILVTNGLRLKDRSYIKMLKEAGIGEVEFSLDGIDPEIYKALRLSPKTGKDKLAALGNLEKECLPVTIAFTVYKGINEKEIKKVFDFALKSKFVYRLKIRTSAKVGRFNPAVRSYFLSELVKIFSAALDTCPQELLFNYLSPFPYYSPYGVPLKIHYFILGKKIIFMPRLAKIMNALYYFLFTSVLAGGFKRILAGRYKSRKRKKRFFRCLHLRLCHWPVLETIDIGELRGGAAHFYGGRILNFCHAAILNDKL